MMVERRRIRDGVVRSVEWERGEIWVMERIIYRYGFEYLTILTLATRLLEVKRMRGNGNSDIFGALRYATNLLFRPAVAKTFILLPCTTCDPSNMTDFVNLDKNLAVRGELTHAEILAYFMNNINDSASPDEEGEQTELSEKTILTSTQTMDHIEDLRWLVEGQHNVSPPILKALNKLEELTGTQEY
uniref:Uncharacterized protein n=1 Tax=Timema bartmani TaxID=61472 RepID=A0A7R9EWB4_9NEOP|nr:unnamed protein product [Timema bartmani]